MEAEDLIYLVSCAVNGRKPDPERIAGMDMDADGDIELNESEEKKQPHKTRR